MNEWKKYRLGDFAEINPTERLPKGTIAKKIAMEVLQPFTKRIPSYSWEEYKGGVKFRNGDTIMARITPSLENGKTSYVDILDDDEVGFGSTEFIVLREKENISDKHFIYYLATSPIIRDTAIKSMTGSSGRQRVQTDVVKEHLFKAPPLPEQRAIAEVLSSLDDKIDLLHRQNQTLEQMAETLFRKWFIEDAKEDWEEVKLGNLINISSGKGLKKEDYSENGLYPVLGANGEIGRTNKFLYDEKLIFTGRVGTLGKVFISEGKVWLSDNTLIIIPKEEEFFYFTYFYLKTQELENLNVGSTQPLIRQSDIYNLEVQTPKRDIILNFNLIIQYLFSKILKNKEQIRTLENLRDTLLPKLMSGEVRVKA
jgi:type I restriction enzyme S subunit